MPRYQNAVPFDIVRSVKGTQNDIRTLQVAASPALVRKPLNQYTAALNPNPFFWGMDPTGWEPTNGTLAIVSDPPDPSPYPYAGLYVNNGVSVGFVDEHDTLFVAQPGQSYQISCYVNASSTSLTLGMNWFDSSVAPLTGPADAVITVTANTWTQIDTILQAPASTAFACPQVGPTAADGSLLYFTGVTCMPVLPAVDTWHSLGTFPTGTTTRGRYRFSLDGELEIDVNLTGTPTSGNFPTTLPVAYRPAVIKRGVIAQGGTLGLITIATTGVVTMGIGAGGSSTADFAGRFALD